MPHPSKYNVEISRYFHRPHLPPSSAMLMEKRLIFISQKTEENKMVTSLLEQHNRRIPDYYPTMYLDGFTPEEIMYAAKRKMYREAQERKAV